MKVSPTVIIKTRVAGITERGLQNFVRDACRAVGLKGSPTLLVTNSRHMRTLNANFRGKDHTTDVLSFPPPSFVKGFSGDIAVSADIAARNARVLGHAVVKEVKILVLHGVLHLAGYDHESDNGRMADKELRLRRKLGLPTALIERTALKRPGPPKTRSRG